MKRAKRITIQKSSHLRVTVFAEGDAERFARLFREQWQAIDYGSRRAMVAYWRSLSAPGYQLPAIEWLHDLQDRPTMRLPETGQWLSSDLLGVVEDRGRLIKFSACDVDAMTEAQVCFLIGHELAHVLQHAKGWIARPEAKTDEEARAADWMDEYDADQIARDWLPTRFYEDDTADHAEDYTRPESVTKSIEAHYREVQERMAAHSIN